MKNIKLSPKYLLLVVLCSFALVILSAFTNNQVLGIISFLIFWLLVIPISIYLYILFVKWIAKTAENAGRSYKGFFLIGLFFPLIAAIIVLAFKPEKS